MRFPQKKGKIASMEKIRRPRGTADITAPEISAWRKIEDTARAVAGNFGYTEIRTPTFEELGLFSRGVGETTDVVIYTFRVISENELELTVTETGDTYTLTREE